MFNIDFCKQIFNNVYILWTKIPKYLGEAASLTIDSVYGEQDL